MKKVFWCGWEVPNMVPGKDMLAAWPDDMRGWRSGYSGDCETFVGVVFADDADAAHELVLSCYGKSAGASMRNSTNPPGHNGRWLGEDEWFAAKLEEYPS